MMMEVITVAPARLCVALKKTCMKGSLVGLAKISSMSPMQKMKVAPMARAMIPFGRTDQMSALGITMPAS